MLLDDDQEMQQIDSLEVEEYNDQRPRRMSEFWTSFSAKNLPESPYASPPESPQIIPVWRREIGLRKIRRWSFSRIIVVVVLVSISITALIQILTSAGETIAAIYPAQVDWFLDSIGQLDAEDRSARWPSDDLTGVEPVSCLSHNDEWQRWPLYAAVNAGCVSFEADVWLFDGEIYVGHSPSELSPDRTLRNTYLEPLFELVQKANNRSNEESIQASSTIKPHGVFPTNPEQSLIFLVDFKTAKDELWQQLHNQLEPLRAAGFLTHFNGTHLVNGAVTVVASGNASFKMITKTEAYRDIFYDAPLDKLSRDDDNQEQVLHNESTRTTGSISESEQLFQLREQYDPTNSYFASTSFRRTVGRVWGSRLTKAQLQLVRSHVQGAHRHGLKARYWETPMWPTGMRNYVWNVLLHEGVDILVIDDLSGATRIDWNR